MPNHVDFFDEVFTVADKIGLMPLMRFAKVAKGGADSADMEALAVMLDLLEQCIAPSEWQRFQDCADRNRADGEELLAVVTSVMETLTERPTSRPSDSSAGPQTTTPNSEGVLSSRVIGRLEDQGRPDLALMVNQARSSA